MKSVKGGIALIAVVLSFFAYSSLATTSAQRESCERGNVSRANQKYIFEYNWKTADTIKHVSSTPEVRDYFADQAPILKRKLNQIEEIDCVEQNKYFGIFK